MANKKTLQRLKLDPYFNKTIETNLNVWSHDQNSYEIKFEFYDHQCDKPIDLTGADMRILLDHADSKPKIYTLEIESKVLGLAKFIMPEQIRGCEGKFTAHIYADYPNKTHDFGSFTFYTQLSRIDGDLGGCMDEIYVSEFETALEDIKKFKVDIDKNINDMKDHFDGRYNEAKADVEEIEKLINENDVPTKNDFYSLKKFAGTNRDKDFYTSNWNNKNRRGIFTFIDDDGLAGFYKHYKPIMEKYSIGFTSAIIGNRGFGGNYMTLDQINELKSLGAEFVSHGYAHDYNYRPFQMTESELDEDLKKAKEIIRKIGGDDEIYVVPFGTNTPMNRRVAMRYYRANILTTRPTEESPKGVVNYHPVDNFLLSRIDIESDLDYIKSKIREAKEKKGWLIFMSHIDQDANSIDRAKKVEEIIRYAIEDVKLEYATVREGLNNFGQLARHDDENGIDADGNAYGSKYLPLDIQNVRKYGINSQLSDFDSRKMTVFKVNNSEARSVGLPVGGTVLCYRDIEDEFSYQIFTPILGSNKQYIRRYIKSIENFGKFETLSDLIVENRASYIAVDAPPSRYEDNKLTYTKVANSQANKIGMSSGGNLITFKSAENDYSYQEFIENKTGKRFIRWVENDEWGTFSVGSREYINFTRTTSGRNLIAGATADLYTPRVSLKQDDKILAQPKTDLPPGIMYNSYVTTGGYVIRVANISAETIELPDIEWHIKVL